MSQSPPDTADRSGAALRAALVRDAMAVVGASAFAAGHAVADRTARAWAAGDRAISDAVLRRSRDLLVEHRQRTGDLICLFRSAIGDRHGQA